MTRSLPFLLLFLAVVSRSQAAETEYDLRYKFKTGDVVHYEVQHRMNVRNTIDEETQEASSQTKSTKAWRIIDVMPNGEIELMNLVERVRMKNKLPGKDEQEYDSDSDETPPAGFVDAAKAVGVPISVIRMTPRGEIIEREMKIHQPAADPNAIICVRLPDEPVAAGGKWNEPLQVTVQLKAGGTKSIEARRHYKLKEVASGIATIGVDYQILSPINAHIEAQLIQRLMKGSVKFDISKGRILSQRFDVDKRVLGYAGATSSMHYVMRMEEKLLEEKAEVARRGARGARN